MTIEAPPAQQNRILWKDTSMSQTFGRLRLTVQNVRSALWTAFILTIVSTAWADQIPAADPATKSPDPKVLQFFEQKIRPLLISKCIECHGPEKQKAGLRLDSDHALRTGGDAGSLISETDPLASLLLEVVSYKGDLKMPPKSKLSDAEIADLTAWVKQGAQWPAEPAPVGEKPAPGAFTITPEQRAFWAFQSISDPALPAVRQEAWIQSPLDRFILSELEAQNLSPAPAADRRTLIRRLTLDLIGLPPTPAEINAYLSDQTSGATERVIDRLLNSPRYGERWARHWLDVARYADSNGLDENLAYANAFRYRDYVVRAFNDDKPFNEFMREQIAGDLIPDSPNPQLNQDRMIATGFLCLGTKMLAEDDPVKMQMDIIDEQIDTIGRAFLGLTVGCARCHDHKYDPLSQADYYALGGIFKSTKTMDNFSVVARWQERPLATPEQLKARDAHQASVDASKKIVQDHVSAANQAIIQTAKQNTAAYLIAATQQRQVAKLTESSKPFGDSFSTDRVEGSILLEAENFVRGNVQKDLQGYGKDIGVLVNRGETPNFVEHEIEIPSDSFYQFELRYAAASERPCRLSVNGGLLKADAAGKVTGSWYPDGQKWFVEGVYPLKPGKIVLRLEHPTFFPHIDKILLVPVKAPPALVASSTSSDQPLISGIVTQFAQALERSEKEPQSPFTIWHRFVANQNLNAEELSALTNGVKGAKLLLGKAPPDSLLDLAQRYAAAFTAAEQAWTDLKSTPAGKDAKELMNSDLEAFRQIVDGEQGLFAVPKDVESGYPGEVTAMLKAARDQLKELESSLPKFPDTMAVSDANPENLKIHIRGSHLTLGAEVPRHFPEILATVPSAQINVKSSGRLELANWLGSPEHPLTPRVIVNRIWQWHFGEGLVRSPDNFGKLGERPTNPQLLDWLARRFIEQGWSMKKFHRMLLLSATYQQSTTVNPEAIQRDPENKLWWRMNRRRMEVEAIRDSLLFVSGGLEDGMGGTQLMTPNRQYVTSTANVNPVVYQTNRRSIYLPVIRSALFELFQAFDFADPSVLNGRRDQTTVAPQALFMMNSAFVLEQSRRLAQGLLVRSDLDPTTKIQQLYETTYGRTASTTEVDRAMAYLAAFRNVAGTKVKADELELRAWTSLCRAILAANEFLYIE